MSYEPIFAHLFGIRPWELDELTYHQWRRLRYYADEVTKQK